MHCSRLAACTTSLTRAQAGRWLDDAHGPFGASLLVPLLGLGFLRSRARSDRPSETLSSRRHCTDRLLRGERLAPGVRPQTKLFAFRFSPLSTAMSPPGALTYDEVRSMSFSPQRLERALRPRSVHAVRRAAPPPPQLAQTRWDRRTLLARSRSLSPPGSRRCSVSGRTRSTRSSAAGSARSTSSPSSVESRSHGSRSSLCVSSLLHSSVRIFRPHRPTDLQPTPDELFHLAATTFDQQQALHHASVRPLPAPLPILQHVSSRLTLSRRLLQTGTPQGGRKRRTSLRRARSPLLSRCAHFPACRAADLQVRTVTVKY
mgnify:CR=1 FL=1